MLQGFEQALERKRRDSPPVPKLLDGEQEAQIIALRLGLPPKGSSWPGGTTAAPMTYMADGRQYIVVTVGWEDMPSEYIALALP